MRPLVSHTQFWDTADAGCPHSAVELNQSTTDSTGDRRLCCDGGPQQAEHGADSHHLSSKGAQSSPPMPTDESQHDIALMMPDRTPADAYQCDLCLAYSTFHINRFRTHLQTEHDTSLNEYLSLRPLHRCHTDGCYTQLTDVESVFCDSCRQEYDTREAREDAVDLIPCPFCGETQVTIADGYCSTSCASLGIDRHRPLASPTTRDEVWQQQPHTTAGGILSSAPVLEKHTYVCRLCYTYGSDTLKGLQTHVSKSHDHSWGEYIELFALRQCRTCQTPLQTLHSYYCSKQCQLDDPAPVRECQGCGRPVDKGDVYCTQKCAKRHKLN